MSDRTDRLYDLLPVVYRERDAAEGEPLRALMAILESQNAELSSDITRLHDAWFIETCDEWVIPYIADLLDVRGLTARRLAVSQRALVANTIAYRRRKGTAAALAGALADTSGWRVAVDDGMTRFALTARLDLARNRAAASTFMTGAALRDAPRVACVRGGGMASARGGPPAASDAGPAPARLAVAVSRLRVEEVPARTLVSLGDGRFAVHPAALDLPLYRAPGERGLPRPIRRGELAGQIGRFASTHEAVPFSVWIRRHPGKALEPLPVERVDVGDLRTWGAAPRGRVHCTLDPERGRLRFSAAREPAEVVMSYSRALAADIGGGDYPRDPSGDGWPVAGWRGLVSREARVRRAGVVSFATLDEALAAWLDSGLPGLLDIADNGLYAIDSPLTLPEGAAGALRIAALEGAHPGIAGDIVVRGSGRFSLAGVILAGTLVADGAIRVDLGDCTLAGADGLSLSLRVAGATAQVERCLLGDIRCGVGRCDVRARDSVLGAVATGAGGALDLARCTVLGDVTTARLDAVDVIFSRGLDVTRTDTGGVSHSFVPDGSRTPDRRHCQPDLVLSATTDAAARRRVLRRVAPVFRAADAGQPLVAMLADPCAAEIRAGGTDEEEMGAYRAGNGRVRESNMQAAIDEYAPLGLDVSLAYVD